MAQLIATNAGGALDGVTLEGDLQLGTNDARVTIVNGLVLNGTATLSAVGSRLEFSGTQTLRHGHGRAGQRVGQRHPCGHRRQHVDPGSGDHGAWRLESELQRGIGYHDWHGGPSNVLVVNQGKIIADTAGMAISTLGQGFTNEGTLEASNGGHLNLTNLQVTSGTVNVRPDSTLSVAGTWSNTGTITSDGGTVNLGGTFTLSTLGTFQRTGGGVNLRGLLDNTGTTLALNAATGSWHLRGGTVRGGTVVETDGAN